MVRDGIRICVKKIPMVTVKVMGLNSVIQTVYGQKVRNLIVHVRYQIQETVEVIVKLYQVQLVRNRMMRRQKKRRCLNSIYLYTDTA